MKKTRLWLLSLLLLLAAARAGQIVILAGHLGFPGLVGADFTAYYTAGRLLDMGQTHQLYDLPAQAVVQSSVEARAGVVANQRFSLAFDNPPPIALLFAALALLPPGAAFILWTLLNVMALAVCALFWWRETHRSTQQLALLFGTTLLCWPVYLGLFYGQVMGLVTLLFGITILALRHNRAVAAGVALALVAAIKPQYVVVLILYLAVKQLWRPVAYTAAVGVLLLLLSMAMVGGEGLLAYLRELGQLDSFAGSAQYLIDPQVMINWRALLLAIAPTLASSVAFWATNGLAAGTVVATLVACRGAWRPDAPRFAWEIIAVTVATLLSAYHSHAHGATLLLVPFLLGVSTAASTQPTWRLLTLTLVVPSVAALAVLGPLALALRQPLSLAVIVWLVVAWLVALREGRRAIGDQDVYAAAAPPRSSLAESVA